MTTLQIERASSRSPAWAPAGCAGLMTIALGASMWVSAHIDADPVVHDTALFAHLASLVLGFGAVLSVDWVALLWLLRVRDLAEPDLSSTATRVKLALVVLIGWNGVLATVLHHPLSRAAGEQPPRRLLLVSGLTATVSQLGWWGAMAIGFANGS